MRTWFNGVIRETLDGETVSEETVTISAKSSRILLPGDWKLHNVPCLMENTVYLFEERPIDCPFQLVRGIQVEHDGEHVVMDRHFNLLFNLTMPKRINSQGCPIMTIYSTMLPGVFISLDPQARMLAPAEATSIKEPRFTSRTCLHHSEQLRSVRLEQDVGSYETWLKIKK